jgi:hypothetical protein
MALIKTSIPFVAVVCSLGWSCVSDAPPIEVAENPDAPSNGGAIDMFPIDDEPGGTAGSPAVGGGVETCAPPGDDASCGGQTFAGESVPLDIYIVFDQSASMCSCLDPGAGQLCVESGCGTTRLDAVREAIDRFLSDPDSAGIGVGLGLFGQQDIGSTSCDASSYGAPLVQVGTLPDQAAQLTEALSLLTPVGETPTGPALRGACAYARDYRSTTPQHQVVLLLLTDGRPEAPSTCRGGAGPCCPSLDDAVLAAGECRDQVGVRTFVLGVGPLLDNLEQIAVAGGTDQAYLVEGGDVGAGVRTALNRIRGAAAIPCELALPEPPPGDVLSLNAVNLTYAAADCALTPFDAVLGAADCAEEDGWYYDDPAAPQRILLCPRSCERVSGPGGNLFYSVGCETRLR